MSLYPQFTRTELEELYHTAIATLTLVSETIAMSTGRTPEQELDYLLCKAEPFAQATAGVRRRRNEETQKENNNHVETQSTAEGCSTIGDRPASGKTAAGSGESAAGSGGQAAGDENVSDAAG